MILDSYRNNTSSIKYDKSQVNFRRGCKQMKVPFDSRLITGRGGKGEGGGGVEGEGGVEGRGEG